MSRYYQYEDYCDDYDYECIRGLAETHQNETDVFSYIMSPLFKILSFLWNKVLEPTVLFVVNFAKSHTILFILSIIVIFLCIGFIEHLIISNKRINSYIKNFNTKYGENIWGCICLLTIICIAWGIIAALIAAIVTRPLNSLFWGIIILLIYLTSREK